MPPRSVKERMRAKCDLDVDIAQRVMGWKITKCHAMPLTGETELWSPGAFEYVGTPPFSSWIGATWMVIDHVVPRRFNRLETTFSVDHWECAVGNWGASMPIARAEAATLPEAVCLATLKAVDFLDAPA